MPLVKGQPGARISENDPVCAVKSTADLEDANYSGHEPRNTAAMKHFENTRHILLNHCEDKDHRIPQQGEDPRPIPPDQHSGKRGPVWTTEQKK
jgi:hypothetical protein